MTVVHSDINESDQHYQPPGVPWLDIRYSDRDIAVINKPSGLFSAPGRGSDKQDSVLTRMQERYPLCRIVHRLDLMTSGIMVVALRRKAEVALKKQFMSRTVKKTYIARVAGRVTQQQGCIELPLTFDPENPPRQKVCHQEGKPAQTFFRVLSHTTTTTLVELSPVTGRSHQLRVHMHSIGHPILGDRLYGSNDVAAAAPRLLLHARTLAFAHPYHGTQMKFDVSPSGAFDY